MVISAYFKEIISGPGLFDRTLARHEGDHFCPRAITQGMLR